MAALLQARNLRAFYAQAEVLHGIDFALNEGGITTILGANGAGKTTTLRAVCGMVQDAGRDQLRRPAASTARATEEIVRGGIAHVPDGRGTFLQLTAEENLRLGAHSRRDRAGVARDLDAGLRLLPAPEGAAEAAGRHALGWRAADAGDRPRADAAARAAAARRAVVRARAADRAGDLRASCARINQRRQE